jgi:hypothetical protein
MQSEQIDKLTEAMAKAQAVMENATLNKINPHFKSKYADLAAIFDAVRKPLAAQGLIVTQTTELREGGFVLVTTLAHSSGQFIKSEYPLPVAGKPQEVGSALTYARRYSLSAITGIAADEDDDANAAQDGPKVDVRGIAPRREPAVIAPPVHPETGDASPHAIAYDGNPVAWGGSYIAAIKTATTADELNAWREHNDAALVEIQKNAPKAHASIMKATLAQAHKIGTIMEAAE